MKLDPRIENVSLIYTPFNENRIDLHKKGYFADDMQLFGNLTKNCVYGELVCYDSELDSPYYCESSDGENLDKFYAFYIPESSLKSVEDKPLTLDEMYEKCMNEIKDLRTELNSVKSQLNKATEQNKSANSCASIRYPEDWFSAQGNRCASIIYPNGFNNWLQKVHFI